MPLMNFPKYILLPVLFLVSYSSVRADDTVPDFSRTIRPLLSDRCFRCHGPDDDSREADLRLDTHSGLFGENGPVVAGHPEDSELIRRVLSADPDEVMPPPSSGKVLSAEERDLLVSWVRNGADWKKHWSFVPPEAPPIPAIEPQQPPNPIDAFLVRKQRQAGLSPSPEADPRVLIRRIFLDLTGLPPTPEESDEWAEKLTGGESTHVRLSVWGKLADHLMSRPAYAERWAVPWLDLARYADTNGYEKDRPRSVWPYRDWVIQAIRNDMPFDQFTIEQIAGDMLPNASVEQQIATGFHRNTMLNEEGGIDPLEFRYHAVTDRVAVTGTTWLGLTLGCCQCHTHKYDPISHREYYRFFALMNNADEPTLRIPDTAAEEREEVRRGQAMKLRASLAEQWPVEDENATAEQRTAAADKAFRQWLTEQESKTIAWRRLQPVEATSNLPVLTIEADGSIFASGDTAKRDDYYVQFAPTDRAITGIRLEAIPDDRLPAGGPGSTYYEGTLGDFFLTELTVEADGQPVRLADASHSYARNRFGNKPVSASLAIDGDVQTGWSVHDGQNRFHEAVFIPDQPVPAGTALKLHMVFGRHFASSLGRFAVSVTSDTDRRPVASVLSEEDRTRILRDAADRTEEDTRALQMTFLMQSQELKEQADHIRKLETPSAPVETLILAERPKQHPRPTFRHHRGEYLQPREQVEPGTPAVLPPLPADAANRLGLARWLVSRENPLTARVIVNRHWAALFGTGIVRTVEDFGLQGEYPSHPELLDWLAVRFMDEMQWSVRSLHRLIVTSAAYRRSSVAPEHARETDPDNRLLSFSPRFRLDAEIIRDRLLQAAGVLHEKQGGPPVRPPQPDGITEVAFGSPGWKADAAPLRFSRSLYIFRKRTAPFAMLSTFDAPSGESCIARRDRSNSPLQALTILNDVMINELAQRAAHLVSEDAEGNPLSDADAADLLFRRIVCRPPAAEEQNMLSEFTHSLCVRLESELDPNQKESPEAAEQTTAAVRTAIARALFALDEVQMRE